MFFNHHIKLDVFPGVATNHHIKLDVFPGVATNHHIKLDVFPGVATKTFTLIFCYSFRFSFFSFFNFFFDLTVYCIIIIIINTYVMFFSNGLPRLI